MSTLDSLLMTSLQSALQASQMRQEVYANNIANANTPGYKRQTVKFDSLLQAQLAKDGYLSGANRGLPMAANSPLDLGGLQGSAVVNPVVQTDTASSVSANGNNVNLNAEMSGLAVNQINYGALVQELTDQFSMLRTAIIGS